MARLLELLNLAFQIIPKILILSGQEFDNFSYPQSVDNLTKTPKKSVSHSTLTEGSRNSFPSPLHLIFLKEVLYT